MSNLLQLDDETRLIIFPPIGAGKQKPERITWGQLRLLLKGKDGRDGTNGTNGTNGRDGAKGDPGLAGKDGTNGAAGAPKRIEIVSGVVAAGGVATVDFSTKPFDLAPVALFIVGWDNGQMISGAITAVTKTSAVAKVMKSTGTLVLNGSPFNVAPAGTPVSILLLGN